MEPAVTNGLRRCLGILIVALHHILAANANLFVLNLDLAEVRNRTASTVAIRSSVGHGSGGLGESVVRARQNIPVVQSLNEHRAHGRAEAKHLSHGFQDFRNLCVLLGAFQYAFHHGRCHNELFEFTRAEILEELPCIADEETVAARQLAHNRDHAADVEQRQHNQIFIVVKLSALSSGAKLFKDFVRIRG